MLMQQTFRAEYNHYKMLLERSRDMKAKSEFCSNKSSSAINSRFDTELSGFGGGDGGNNGGGDRAQWQPALRATHHGKFQVILSNDCAALPKARAQCGSSARRDLSGGHRVTGVSTGIPPFFSYLKIS